FTLMSKDGSCLISLRVLAQRMKWRNARNHAFALCGVMESMSATMNSGGSEPRLLSPYRSRKRSRMARRLTGVLPFSPRKAHEVKYSARAHDTLPGVLRVPAPIATGAAARAD